MFLPDIDFHSIRHADEQSKNMYCQKIFAVRYSTNFKNHCNCNHDMIANDSTTNNIFLVYILFSIPFANTKSLGMSKNESNYHKIIYMLYFFLPKHTY